LLGIILGMASGRSKIFNKLFGTTLNAVRAVPGIAWLPLSMIWFGIGFKVTLFLIALAAFFPVYLNTSSAAQNFDQRLIKTGRMLGLDKLRCLIYILIPGCLPQISSGLRLALGISWAYLVLGELTGVSEGLGAFIMDARLAGRVDMIIVGILIIALAGKISDMLLKIALKLSFKSLRRAN
jgi:NitT/TauT family transport system permease protein